MPKDAVCKGDFSQSGYYQDTLMPRSQEGEVSLQAVPAPVLSERRHRTPLQPACVSFEAASVSYHSPDTCHTRSLPSQGEKDNYEKPASFPGVAGASLEVQKYAGIVVGIPNSKVRNPKPQNSMSPASPFSRIPQFTASTSAAPPAKKCLPFPRNFVGSSLPFLRYIKVMALYALP